MRPTANRCGYTILEVLMAITVMGFVGICATSMLIAAMKTYDSTTVQGYTDTDAVTAMHTMVYDVREAKSVSVLGFGTRLSITPPVRNPDGSYDRTQSDPSNAVEYYRSDATGVTGRDGTMLWRSVAGVKSIVKRDVSNLEFGVDTPRSVRITINTKNQPNNMQHAALEAKLTQRVVYLRNY